MQFKVIDAKTLEEPDLYEVALQEEWAHGLCYGDVSEFAMTQDGYLVLLDTCGNCAYVPPGRFKVVVKEDL